MAVFILKDQKFYVDAYDLSGDTSTISLEFSAADLDRTTFGNDSQRRLAGLMTAAVNQEGFYQVDANDPQVDDALFARIAGASKPITIGKAGGADGGAAWLMNALTFEYQPFGAVGDIAPFTTVAQSDSELVDATIVHSDAAAETASGNGTGRQLGAVTAAQKLYAGLHVVAVSGTTPTLDVVVESDDNSGFTSPATQITFAQATAITSEFATVAGAITDDWWRVTFTIGGTTPSFTFVVALGIR